MKTGALSSGLSTSGTSVIFASNSLETLSIGDLLQIDDEILYITDVPSQSVITVSRAAFNTTLALHLTTTNIYKYDIGEGRTLTSRTFEYNADTNDNVFDLGRPLDLDIDGNKFLHGDLSWVGGGVRHYDHWSIRVGQLLRMDSHSLTGDSVHETSGHVVTRLNVADLASTTFSELVYAHRRLTEADETVGHGAEDDDALVLGLRSVAAQVIYHFQAYLYLVSSSGASSDDDDGGASGTTI